MLYFVTKIISSMFKIMYYDETRLYCVVEHVFVWRSLLVWSLVCYHFSYSIFGHDHSLWDKFVFYGWALLFAFVSRNLLVWSFVFCHLSCFIFVHRVLWDKFVFCAWVMLFGFKWQSYCWIHNVFLLSNIIYIFFYYS